MKNKVAIRLWIGIDPGVNGGVCAYDPSEGRIMGIDTLDFWDIISYLDFHQEVPFVGVVMEDARKRGAPRGGGAGRLQNVGKIKERCRILEEYLKRRRIPYLATQPRNTKMKDGPFRKLTGVDYRTNDHERDAAMLVFGRPKEYDIRFFDNNFTNILDFESWRKEEEKRVQSLSKKSAPKEEKTIKQPKGQQN